MSATQTLEIFRLLNRYFKNEEDATRVVEDIEFIVDKKLADRIESLATKEDLMRLESQMNAQFRWLVGIIIAGLGIAVAIIKM